MSVNHPYNAIAKLYIATLSQAAPVQNTWYTVLDTTQYVRVVCIGFQVADTGETLEVRLTIDGETATISQAAGADTKYYAPYKRYIYPDGTLLIDANANAPNGDLVIEGHSMKIEIRKTTANGAGTITAAAQYNQG